MLHAIRLKTGKDVVVTRTPERIEGVEIERPGAVYYFNRPGLRDPDNPRPAIGYVPTALLEGKLG